MWQTGHGDHSFEGVRRGVRARGAGVLALALAATLLVACGASASRAEGLASGGARVVWVTGADAYVATADSSRFVPGTRIALLSGDRVWARGEVVASLGAVARVRLDAALPADTPLAALTAASEPPGRAATLRVGVPASGRANLLVRCARTALRPEALPRAYASEPLAGGARLVATDTLASPWPDTIVVRAFGDRDDQEIALERGELDAAVFWPGEPSARLRLTSNARLERGLRTRGGLAIASAPADSSRARAAIGELAAMGEGLLGGDLAPWPGAVPEASGAPIRWTADAALPGRAVIEGFLHRARSAPPRAATVVRVAWLDAAPDGDAARDAAWRARGITPAFALQSAVVWSASRAADARRLDAGALANLFDCAPAARRP